MGSKTSYPCMRFMRPYTSLPVKAYMFPTWSPSAEGYGNIMRL